MPIMVIFQRLWRHGITLSNVLKIYAATAIKVVKLLRLPACVT